MNPEGENNTKKYYSIREVADFIKVTPSLLRYWERVLPGIKPRTNKKGTRFYTVKDIDYLRYIHFLVKEKGLTLKGTEQVLRNKKTNNEKSQYELLDTLEKFKGFLLDLKKNLEGKGKQ